LAVDLIKFMLAPVVFALALAGDLRPDLVQLQLQGRNREALARVDAALRDDPEGSRRLGLDYLQGALLALLGRSEEAAGAFGRTMATTPRLASYGRYRLALDQDRQRHPETAAGLLSHIVAEEPDSPLAPDAIRLLAHSLSEGGDCQVLGRLGSPRLLAAQQRELLLAQADCAQRTGWIEMARGLLVGLLREARQDDFARGAAERLARMVSPGERGALPLLLGLTFQQHREFERAAPLLAQALAQRSALSAKEAFAAQLALGRSELAQQRYREASMTFNSLVERARTADEKAESYSLQGRAFEAAGLWSAADVSYRAAYRAEPGGGAWRAPALLAALRIEWRSGREAPALALYEQLWYGTADPELRHAGCRAALFLAVSDVVQGKKERVHPWLDRAAARCPRDGKSEVAYWQGRLAELEGNPKHAVASYLELLKSDPYHPLAASARGRLTGALLAPAAAAEGRRLAQSGRLTDLHGAWLLLPGSEAQEVQKRLVQRLAADRRTAPYLALAEVAVGRWPLWEETLDSPEEMLLALGRWHEGAPAIAEHFPVSDPSLGLTGAGLLARGGDWARSIARAEALHGQIPARLPAALLPRPLRLLLYPLPYAEVLLVQSRLRGVDEPLLAALIREQSRFDAAALSAVSARGLTQLSLPTARALALRLNLERLGPEDLYQPGLSIALGATHLGLLLKRFGGIPVLALAGYQAGETQAIVWHRYCFSGEPEEYFTKIEAEEARDFVRRVLATRAQYAELYK
jgi:tetratricopeptide (TPR) repeat protein